MAKRPLHDLLFKETYQKPKYALDIFRLVFTKKEFGLFNWKTLRPELTTYVDEEWKEKRTDLLFSVRLKNSQKTAKILFLLEHKSRKDDKLLFQILAYQALIYARQNHPVIPILIYQGRKKGPYPGPLVFQESLATLTPALKKAFGKNILNFTARLLNIQEFNIGQKKDLTTKPILFIMRNVFSLNKKKVEELFGMGEELSRRERKALMERAVDYIHQYDKAFSWKVLQEIEEKILDGEDRIMPALKISLDEAESRGVKKGIEKGIERGKEEVALQMLEEGADIRMICQYTKLTPEQVKQLSKKMG
ncbi:MAG: Rpn family recombination-promoting nuclease/putative transposase [Bacteriovoracales bacterium]|nr:Rpn family recombination-promoting nuclease/putative transposase [Bacteriovoracales bacterium]